MTKTSPFAAVLVPLMIALACSGDGGAPAVEGPADLIVVGADIRTSDPDNPTAVALAVKDGRVLAVGSDRMVRALAGPSTEIVDARSATVLPGLIDGHTHISGGASLVNGVDLTGISDKATWLEMIARRSAELPEGEWLTGGRWDHTLSDGVLPTRADLDRVVPERPVVLSDIDGHSTWVNTKALELAGITRDSEVPPGGEIVLDPETGEPTGILLEGASGLVSRARPARDESRRRSDLRSTVSHVLSMGITSAHDMSGRIGLSDYLSMVEDGDLRLRVWYGVPAARSVEQAEEYATLRGEVARRVEAAGLADEWGPLLALGYFKAVIDGVLSTRTAVMLEPYSDAPEVAGVPFQSAEDLTNVVRLGNSRGFPVAIHAIGDGAVRMTLDAFEEGGSPTGLRNRIEHIEVVTPEDVDRFAELGVAASMQPNHGTGVIGKYITPRIGVEREPNAYVWGDMLRHGVHLVFGSDWATSPLSPLVQIADAVFRESPTGLLEGTWYPDNAVTFEEALHAYTQGGADMTAWADEIGSLTVGKWADFVILDGTLPRPLDRSIRERNVQATYVAGKKVYERP